MKEMHVIEDLEDFGRGFVFDVQSFHRVKPYRPHLPSLVLYSNVPSANASDLRRPVAVTISGE